MPEDPKILVLVPAYNEEDNIVDVISSLHRYNPSWDILVINDASVDKTSELAKDTGMCNVIDLPYNMGIGGGIQTGFRYAVRHGYDIVFQFDGDGQHLVEETDKLLKPFAGRHVDVVIGSRFLEKNDGFRSSLTRRFGILVFSGLTRLLIGKRITDCTSGFRAYSKRAFTFLSRNYPIDYPEPEAIILLGHNGFSLEEVPVRMQHRKWGRSTITFLNSPYYMIKVILGMIMTKMRRKNFI